MFYLNNGIWVCCDYCNWSIVVNIFDSVVEWREYRFIKCFIYGYFSGLCYWFSYGRYSNLLEFIWIDSYNNIDINWWFWIYDCSYNVFIYGMKKNIIKRKIINIRVIKLS